MIWGNLYIEGYAEVEKPTAGINQMSELACFKATVSKHSFEFDIPEAEHL